MFMFNSPWAKVLKISPLAPVSQREPAAPVRRLWERCSWRSGVVSVAASHPALAAPRPRPRPPWQVLPAALLVEEVCLH